MAVTRIKNNQITDGTVTGSKLASNTITAGLLEDNLTYGSNLTISGNLTVNGTTTTVDTTNTLIADPLFVLSRGETGTPSADSGIVIERGTSTNVAFIWDESADVFAVVNTTEDGSTAGDIAISSYADMTVANLIASSVALGNIDITGNTISSTDTNGNINLTPNGSGEVIASTLTVSDLTDNRVLLAGTSGAIEDSSNLTFDGTTLAVTGAATISTTLGVTGESTLASATISDLTSGRVVLAGTAGAIEDSSNLTFNGTTLAVTGAATISTTLGVSGESTLASATVSDLTSGRVVLAGTAGAIEDSGNLTFDGSTLTVTGDVSASGDLGSATATITGNATVGGTLGVTGESTLASATVSDLTSGRVVLAGTAGAIEDSANLTFDGTTLAVTGAATVSTTLGVTGATTLSSTLDVTGLASLDGGIDVDGAFTVANTTGNISTSGTLSVTGESTLASATVSDLTSGRVVLAGTAGSLEDSGNLTFNGSTLDVTGAADVSGNATVGGTLGVTGESTLASATVSDLTSGRVVLAGTAGAIEDSGNLTFDGTTLTTTAAAVDNVTIDSNTVSTSAGNLSLSSTGGEVIASSMAVSDLTDNRIVVAGTSGALEDDANLTWNGTAMGVTGGVDITGDLDIDNINIDGNAITSTNSNGNIDITPNGTGATNITNLNIAGLTADRVMITDASGTTATDNNLTWDGTTLGVTGEITVDNITIDGDTISSVHSTITIDPSTAGAGGTVIIEGNLQVTGTTTTVDSTVVTIADPIFQLGENSADSLDRGIKALYNDGAAKIAFFGLDDSASEFIFIADATDSASVMSGSLGSAAFGSLRVTDLTSTRITFAGASGELQDSANLTFDGTTLSATALEIDNVQIDGNTITTTAGNLTIDSNGNEVFIDSLTINDLTDNRVLLAGTAGAVEDSANLTFDGTTLAVTGAATISTTLGVTGATTLSSTLGVTGESTLASATVSDLTSGRVTLAGTAGSLEDSANLTFDGTTLTTTAAAVDNVTIDGNTVSTSAGNLALSSTGGEVTAPSMTVSDLTSGRVTLAGTAGSLEDSANLTFNGSTLAVTGAVTVSTTLDVTGESTLASATVSDLTSGRVTLAGTSGSLEDSANLTFDGTTLTTTAAAIDNVSVDGNTVTTSAGGLTLDSFSGETTIADNATVSGTLDVTGATTLSSTLDVSGESTLASATVSDLTSGRVVLAGTAGAIEDSANLTFNGSTLAVTGAATVSTTLDVSGESTLASATVSDLTSGRIVLAGTAGSLEDSGNLTFDGSTLAVTGAATISTTLDVSGESTLASATVSDLTSGRVVLAGTSGAIEDSANLTFDGTSLNVTGNVVIDNITIDGNSISSSNAMTFDAASGQSIVINEAGTDVDVRIESDTQVNAFFVEGSTGNIGIRTATPTAGAAITISTTDSIIVPAGTTAQRPGTPAEGMMRYNSSLGQLEFYDSTEWKVAGAEFTIIVADSFAGDGSTLAFTLSEDATSAGLLVAINGVVQDPGTAYSVSGTTLTFTEAPASGDNIDARLITTTTQVTQIAEGNTSIGVDDAAEKVTNTINGNVVMEVTNAAVVPGANVTYDLGTSSLRWKDLWLSGTTIALGDLRLKDNGSGALGIYAADGTTPANIAGDSVDLPDDYTYGSNFTISGNLTVNGTTTTINSTTLTVDDLNVVLASGAASAAAANGAGITVDGASATITYASTGDKWVFNKAGDFGANTVTAATFSGNATTATTATNVNVTANNTANETVYLTFVDGATGAQGIETDTNLSYNPSTNTLSTTATSAQYADLAENYTADAEYAPGTVVSFGGDAEVTVNGVDMDRKVAGVVSTDPAHLMNANCEGEHVVALALQGRVPCKVVGAVEKGDLMVAAGNGFARAEADPKVGTVIGKALEAHSGGEGVIEVAVGRF